MYFKAINKLADAASHRGIKLRQTYRRVGKAAAIMVSRYAHAKQFKRMRRKLKKLRTWLGRVIRDLRRKVPHPDVSLLSLLELYERLHAQQKHDKKKLYSLHEPSVMCVSKGKAHKRYEFGQKISVSTTNRGNWIVGVNLCQNNPYDRHTLSSVRRSPLPSSSRASRSATRLWTRATAVTITRETPRSTSLAAARGG